MRFQVNIFWHVIAATHFVLRSDSFLSSEDRNAVTYSIAYSVSDLLIQYCSQLTRKVIMQQKLINPDVYCQIFLRILQQDSHLIPSQLTFNKTKLQLWYQNVFKKKMFQIILSIMNSRPVFTSKLDQAYHSTTIVLFQCKYMVTGLHCRQLLWPHPQSS